MAETAFVGTVTGKRRLPPAYPDHPDHAIDHLPHPVPKKKIDFRRLMGELAWRRLNPEIRTRFAATALARRRRFEGIMTWVETNLAGWLLANLARLAGTPLAPYRGTDVPIKVDVYPEGDGQVWARRYLFDGKPPVTVASTKRIDGDGGMLECLGRGFGMKLRVYEEKGMLCFRSLYHFWQLGRFRVRLPALCSPGDTVVQHEDLGHGVFRFALTIDHPWFGRIVDQDGVFTEMEAAT